MTFEKKVIYSFEDLEVYKLVREFSNKVSQLIKKLPKEEEYNLKAQMRRAKLSMTMVNLFIKFILISLIIFTPIAFGSVELWAFSLMELGILLIIILWAIQKIITPNSELKTSQSAIRNPQWSWFFSPSSFF